MRTDERARDSEKSRAAERAVEFVEDGQTVGLGTGSTATFAIHALGRRVSEGLRIRGVPTSNGIGRLATELGIPIASLNEVERVDITLDGADQIDPMFNMIKGGGGALIREKLVAIASELEVIVVDSGKLVDRLGEGFSLPVEVVPFGWRLVERSLKELGCEPRLRLVGESVFVSDNDNYILDCEFHGIADPAGLERTLKQIHGVVECGLFIGLADKLVIGLSSEVEIRDARLAEASTEP
ncbi:MAG TPA: ribose-5-phosphate isomerase RpiA [Blastocatellia bacterium]|nr:ribose-5-phosphate isomerase RpiA [Blastocatellia bacterium]